MGSSLKMGYFKKNLQKLNYDVFNWGYRSRNKYIQEHAEDLVPFLEKIAKEKPNQPIHFTTHSMGALVLLATLNHPECPIEAKQGKIILITPPLRGCSFARSISKYSIIRKVIKLFSGKELSTYSNFDYLGQFPHSSENILIITGSQKINHFLKEKNDGLLTISETSLSIPHKQIVVSKNHRSVMFSKKVFIMIKNFLLEKIIR